MVGSLCVCVCVWVKRVCCHVHLFWIFSPALGKDSLNDMEGVFLNHPLLSVFICCFFIYILRAEHCWHIILLYVNILDTELYRVFITRWNILNLHNHQPSTFLCIFARHTANRWTRFSLRGLKSLGSCLQQASEETCLQSRLNLEELCS